MRWLACCFLIYLVPVAPAGAILKGKVTLPEGATVKKTVLDPKYSSASLKKLKKPSDPSPAVVWLEQEGTVFPAARDKTAEIRQHGLEFRPRVLAVQTGTTVRFINGDPRQHHVASYSRAKKFDAGYKEDQESFETVFDQAGRVSLICEVHSHMQGYVVVVDSPWFAVASPDGAYEISGIPEGKYAVVVWHEDYEPQRKAVEIKADGATVDLELPAK